MKDSFFINQYAVYSLGLAEVITVEHLIVMDCITYAKEKCILDTVTIGGETWFDISYRTISELCPILRATMVRTRSLITDLGFSGMLLIINDADGKIYIQVGPMYKRYIEFPTEKLVMAAQVQSKDNFYISELTILISVFNDVMRTKIKENIIPSILKNYAICRTKYSPQEIQQAIHNIPNDKFWCDKMSMTILFRTKNTAKEPVDYITDLLNQPKSKMETAFSTAFNTIMNGN